MKSITYNPSYFYPRGWNVMEQPPHRTLMDAVVDVPDPRHARGKRYAWPLLLTLITAALVGGQRSGRAIGQWVHEHGLELLTQLPIRQHPLPSTSTLRRALQAIDVERLEQRVAQFVQRLDQRCPPPATSGAWHGQAIDGKAVRGANRHGAKLHLVSLVRHGSARVRKQVRVRDKSNEITAVPDLLAGVDLQGTVTTLDSLLCQQEIARQIVRQRGHYLMVVKENQPALYAAIELVFRCPPPAEAGDHLDVATTVGKAHGRLETRTLERTAAVNDYVAWPAVGQVLRRTCERITVRTGEVSREVTLGVTSLAPTQASAAEVERLWRGHWGIENQVHYVRDETMGEDRGQIRCGQAAHALAVLRNGILSLLRSHGVTQIADALRHHGASVAAALALIGVPL
jgi:predicted transposase YbfD/YdcC